MNILVYVMLAVLGVVGDFLKAFLTKRFIEETNTILPMALQAVSEIAANPGELSSQEKFDMARDKLLRELTTQAISVGNSAINWAIETAYQKYKAS